MIMNFVAGFDGQLDGASGDRKEVDLTIDYHLKVGPLKNFWLRVRGSWLDEYFAGDHSTDYRVILRYDVPII